MVTKNSPTWTSKNESIGELSLLTSYKDDHQLLERLLLRARGPRFLSEFVGADHDLEAVWDRDSESVCILLQETSSDVVSLGDMEVA